MAHKIDPFAKFLDAPPPSAPTGALASVGDDPFSKFLDAPAPPPPPAPAPEPEPAPAPVAEAPPSETPGRLEALARGVKQGASLGFGDEISGLIESVFTDKTYKQARDEARAADEAAKKAHGGYYGAGEVGGGLASALIPGGLAVKGVATGVKGAALAAGLSSAATAVGDSKADLTTASGLGDVTKDALISGATGAALGGVAHKAIGALVESAPQRYLKMFTKEMTEGATPTASKKFAEAASIAPEVLAGDKAFMKAAKASPGVAQDIAKKRLGELAKDVGPLYDKFDQQAGKMPLGSMESFFDKKINELSGEPGMEAVRDALQKTKDNASTAWAHKFTNDEGTVMVPTQDVRHWVTRLLKHNDAVTGQINEGTAKQIKSEIFDTANDYLKSYLKNVAETSPHLAEDVSNLSALNKKIAVWARTEELMEHKEGREFWKKGGLIEGLKKVGIPGLAGVLGATGGLATGGLAVGGAIAGQQIVKTTDKVVTKALANLMASVKAGNVTAKAVKDAIEAGVPVGAVTSLMNAKRAIGEARNPAPEGSY